MLHTVIIPRSIPNETHRKFIPYILKIQKGDIVRWINMDEQSHFFNFYKIFDNPPYFHTLKETLSIKPGESRELTFDYNYNRIDYKCKNHIKEINSITILNENYESMDNTQRLKHIGKRYSTKPLDLQRYLVDRAC